jgi:transposase
MSNNSMLFVGLDLGDRHSHVAVLDQEGNLLEEARLPSGQPAFRRNFSDLPSSRIAMEVGTHSRWASQFLRELGPQVLVANARKLRAIYDNPCKGDRVDAQTLARLARLEPELLSPVYHRSPQAQADLGILRSRDALVRSRTLLINHVRGTAKAAGVRLASSSAHGFVAKVAPDMPVALQAALFPILESIATLDQHIRDFDLQIEALCRDRYPQVLALRRVAGVGPLTALAFILAFGNPHRFQKSRQVGPDLGLVPKRDQPGDRDPQLRITKAGNTYLRRLLVNCAQYILGPFGPDFDLRRWGLRLAERGGKSTKRRAVLAVARKLAILLHRLWATGEAYEPSFQPDIITKQTASLSLAV